MADINVSLGLDDAKYRAGLARAEQQAKSFGTTVSNQFGNTGQAIGRLAGGVDALNVRFQNLGRVIVGVGLATFVASALRSAEAIGDLSGALGVSTERLLEMEAAAGIAGGNLETVSGMIARMEGNLQDAADGNEKMRKSLDAVGIGFADIQNKTPDQLFNSIALALAKMDNPLQRAAIGSELLGKAARTFDFGAYVGGINNAYGAFKQYDQAIKDADKMMEGFRHTMALVGSEFLKLVNPVTNLIAPLTETNDAMGKASVIAKVLAGALALFAASATINAVKTLAGTFTGLTGSLIASTGAQTAETQAVIASSIVLANNLRIRMAGAAARVASLEASLAAARAEIANAEATVVSAGATKAAERATWLLVSARAALAEATAAAGVAQTALTGATTAGTAANVANAASGAGILAWLGKYKVALTAVAAATALLYSSNLNEGEDEELNRMRKSAEAADLLNGAISRLTVAQRENYSKLSGAQKAAYADTLRQQEAQARLTDIQNKIMGGPSKKGGWAISEEDQKKIDESNKKQQSALRDLQTGFQTKNAEQLKGLEYSMKAVTLTERERAITQESNEAKQRYTQQIADLEKRRLDLQDNLRSKETAVRESAKKELPLVEQAIRNVTTAYEQQLPAIEAAAAAAIDAAQRQKASEALKQYAIGETARQSDELLRIQDEMAKMTLPAIEQKYYDIAAAARDSANQAIRAENERRRLAGQSAMSAAEEAKYRAAATASTDKLVQATRRSFEQSRSWSTGWKRAMNEYVDNATNASKRAEYLFRTATQGMEEAIVNFAKTGKFEFSNFLEMMLEELLRSQIQQTFAAMMMGMQNTMRATSFMPGESGGIPTRSSGGGILSSIGNVIGSIGSSIGKLFGGFFADGGTLGAGKWGIAGERGPEIISGPANITPMGMGSTYVTYNINAVDAMSFKQMVAQDPAFIHAVASKGARSIPGTRR